MMFKWNLVAVCLTWMLWMSGPAWSQQWVYTVVDGDNLWDLSEKYLHRVTYWQQLRKINRVEHPRRMQPGTQLRIPLKWVRVNPVPAQIIAIEGQAELRTSEGTSTVGLSAGSNISLGDRLSTAPASSVAVRFADASLLTIHENSVVRFDHLSAYGDSGMVDTRVNLLSGRTDTRVTPASGPGSRFEIHTPSAVSAVRGTSYRVAAEAQEGLSNIEVLSGSVAVQGARRARLIAAGFGTQVVAGSAPQAPKKLLPAPEVDALPDRVRQFSQPIIWQSLAGALAYRVEVSSSAGFDTILWERRLETTRTPLPVLEDGAYFARVRGIDEQGLEGKNSTLRYILDARPQPPVLLKPSDGELFRAVSPSLAWTASADARRYRLQIAKDAAFAELLIDDEAITSNRYDTDAITQPGRYYWRVASLAADAEQGPMTPIRSWEIKPIPLQPEVNLSTPAAKEETVVASWQAADREQSFQVQLALDSEFETLVFDQTVTQSQVPFDLVSGQVRYLRVRTIEPDGFIGPWGATQRVDPIQDHGWLYIVIPAILAFLLI